MKKILPILIVLGLAYAAYTKFQGTRFRYSGTLEAEETDISPGVSSQIDSVEVKEGDTVKAGQVLVKLQCQEVRISAANCRATFPAPRSFTPADPCPRPATTACVTRRPTPT